MAGRHSNPRYEVMLMRPTLVRRLSARERATLFSGEYDSASSYAFNACAHRNPISTLTRLCKGPGTTDQNP